MPGLVGVRAPRGTTQSGGAIGLLQDSALVLRGVRYLHTKDYVYHGSGFAKEIFFIDK